MTKRKWRQLLAIINVMGVVELRMRTTDLAPYLGRAPISILDDLHYLEHKGFLASEWESARSDGKARRRYYTLTELGFQAYQRRESNLERLIEFMKGQ